jgi:hypothetical protein
MTGTLTHLGDHAPQPLLQVPPAVFLHLAGNGYQLSVGDQCCHCQVVLRVLRYHHEVAAQPPVVPDLHQRPIIIGSLQRSDTDLEKQQEDTEDARSAANLTADLTAELATYLGVLCLSRRKIARYSSSPHNIAGTYRPILFLDLQHRWYVRAA